MGEGLRTDLYELTMAASYLRRDMTAPATFSLFVRDLPPGWGFVVACGLESAFDRLERLGFDERDLAWLGSAQGFDDDALEALRRMRFTGDVVAVPEGRIVFAGEPILEVTAPLPEAQLVETVLLNQVTYQSAVASTAARCAIAAGGRDLVDFSFRRVHGLEASLGVARATAIAGFAATSNVEAARSLGIPAAGTMAHSYVEAFSDEEAAFRAYAEDFPGRVVLLVDTYDTTRGVERAIRASRAGGHALHAIRLDSGDLGALAREARAALDDAGLRDTRILASGGLDEHEIAALADAPIDAFGVGSRVGTSAGAPYLDSVYKLVDHDGRPVAKLSEGKATLPGRKQAWRGEHGDRLGLREEPAPEGGEPLLLPAFDAGRRLVHDDWPAARDRLAADLAGLPGDLRRLDARPAPVPRTEALARLDREVRARLEASG